MIKKISIALFISLLFLVSFGQDRKDLIISFSTGLLNSPYYKKATPRGFYGLGFDYYVTKKHIISANYFAGKHEYLDDVLSNTPTYISYPHGTNAQASYNTFSVSYKYKITVQSNFSILPTAGAGIMTHTRKYPYSIGNSTSFQTSSWSDLVFPVSLDVNYQFSQHWRFGVTGGFLIHPDYPILALHAGPTLSYILQ